MLLHQHLLPYLKKIPTIYLIVLGVTGFLPFSWLRPHGQLFGIFAVVPLVNLALIGAGMALTANLSSSSHLVASQLQHLAHRILGPFFTILAIGGFISLPFWPSQWLHLMTNTIASDILYGMVGIWLLYKGFFAGAAQASSTTPLPVQQ
jgi:hypothetical protein